MKIIIFYNSKFGNGKLVGEYMAKLLNEKNRKNNAKAYSVQESQPKQLEKADLYVFSSSTHIGNAPFKTRIFLKKLRKQNGAKYILVTTNLVPQKAKTLKTMRDILLDKGFVEVKEPLVLRVDTMKGPLEKDYQKKIRDYLADIG